MATLTLVSSRSDSSSSSSSRPGGRSRRAADAAAGVPVGRVGSSSSAVVPDGRTPTVPTRDPELFHEPSTDPGRTIPHVWLTRAEIALARNDIEGATTAAEGALMRDPDPDTAAASLLLLWSLAKRTKDAAKVTELEQRLSSAYPESPAAQLVRRVAESPRRSFGLRWTYALDGTLQIEEVNPPDRTPPPPSSP